MAAKSNVLALRQAVEILRVICPTQYPVSVRRSKLTKDIHGDAEFIIKGGKRFKIRIKSDVALDFQIWVLIHEWAHCMTWDITHLRHDDHGAHFGVAYSEAYRAIYL